MTDIVHQREPRGSGLMPCCGLSPLETEGERRTTNPKQVTCGRGEERTAGREAWTAEQHAGHGSPCETRPDGSCAQPPLRPAAEPDDSDLTERREQIAEELARLDCAKFEHPVPDKDHDFWRVWRAQADAVLAVRDTKLRQLQAERDRVREWLPALRRAVDSLPAVCRYHGERLDPPQDIFRREACCDTGVPARRRRQAEQALAALDRPQEA